MIDNAEQQEIAAKLEAEEVARQEEEMKRQAALIAMHQ